MIFKILVIFIVALLSISKVNSLKCLTGEKILVRQKKIQQNGQISYKLNYKCLCPHNYFGGECSYHSSLYCYLKPLEDLGEIDEHNIQQEMRYQLSFSVECWVDHMNSSLGMFDLRQYLSKYNQQNLYGVREQFGENFEIVWANTTTIFDKKNDTNVINEDSQQNKTQKQNQEQNEQDLIGNNTQFYEKPFTYTDDLLGYAFINSNIQYQIQIVDPINGVKAYSNLSNTEVDVSNIQQYIQSYNDMEIAKQKGQSLIKNITKTLQEGTLQDIISQFWSDGKINNLEDLNKYRPQDLREDTKVLPIIRLPLTLNPYNLTSYQAIRIQLQIQQHYQSNLKHKISMNSLSWTIPVKIKDLGLPLQIQKKIYVTDHSFKSYYKILAVVSIALIIYFVIKKIHKKYKKQKTKFYTEDTQNVRDQISLRSSSSTYTNDNRLINQSKESSVRDQIPYSKT